MRLRQIGLSLGLTLSLLVIPCFCRGETPQEGNGAQTIRMWTDSTGRFHTEAILLDGDLGHIRLQTTHGSVLTIAVAQLSTADQSFVSEALKQPAQAGRNPSSSSVKKTTDSTTAGESACGSQVAAAVNDLSPVAIASRLIIETAPPLPENMVYIRLSREFLEKIACQDVSQRSRVSEYVLGYPVAGVSRTTGTCSLELQPSDSSGLAVVRFFGSTNYDTVADGGPVQVHTSGVTRFSAAKAIRFDSQGIHLGPAVTNAETTSRVTGVETSLPRLRGRIALRIGGRRAAETRLAAAAVTSQHTARQVNQGFDETARGNVAALSKTLSDSIATLAADDPLRHCSWQARSTADAMQIVLVASPTTNDHGPLTMPVPIAADAEMEVQVHVALIRRVMADPGLQKLLQPATMQLASTSGSSAGSLQAGHPVMQWSKDRNWLSVTWQNGDRQPEPSRPNSAILARQGE